MTRPRTFRLLAPVILCLGCGNNVVVSPTDAGTSHGAGGSGSGGKCAGEELWTQAPNPFDDIAYGAWTGDELILWGIGSGVGYRFHSNAWREISSTPPLGLKSFPLAAVSSGRFFVWDHAGGGAYDWRTDAWSRMTPMGGEPNPDPDVLRPAVGAPTHLFYLGGNFTDGIPTLTRKIYDVAQDAWQSLPNQAAPTAANSVLVWAETELLVWGGYESGQAWQATNVGARFNPSTTAWTPMTTVNAPAPRTMPTAAVWTGQRLFVWGGYNNAPLLDGGLYDPVRDDWTRVTKQGAPTKPAAIAAWTGSDVIVLGSETGSHGRYNPSTDTWRPMMPPPEAVWHVVQWDQCRLLAYSPSGFYIYEPPPER